MRRNPVVAREGLPFLIATVIAMAAAWHFGSALYLLPFAILLLWQFFVFRDPPRDVPAVPLGIISPVDGTVSIVELTDESALNGDAHRIVIVVDSFGTYTARCPTEGKIMDFRAVVPDHSATGVASGLWVQTDEGDDVVLQFHRHRFGVAPHAFLGYGERVAQGQRCAYLRLTRVAEVQLPINSRVLVHPGQAVTAGVDILAKLPHH